LVAETKDGQIAVVQDHQIGPSLAMPHGQKESTRLPPGRPVAVETDHRTLRLIGHQRISRVNVLDIKGNLH
jgi:hypothetical protein